MVPRGTSRFSLVIGSSLSDLRTQFLKREKIGTARAAVFAMPEDAKNLYYLVAFALGALVLVTDGARAAVDLSPIEAISAAATTLGNVGRVSDSSGRWAPSSRSATSRP
jgi:hypothetical protein